MNKRLIWGVVVVVIIILVVWAGRNKSGTTSSTEAIKIGVVAPLTGGKAQIGEGLRQAILLAQKDFGTTTHAYQFIFEDSGGESAKSASAVKKLVSIDKVNAFISITSQDGNIVNKAAEESHIPHFGIANDHGVSKGDYNFVHWTPIDQQSKLFVSELQKRGIHKVAIFVETNDSSVATIDSFKKNIEGTDIKIVWMQNFTKGTNDFRTSIQEMLATKPDLIMLENFSPMIEITTNQLKELNVKIPVSSVTYIGTSQNLKLFEGDWYVSGGQPSQSFSDKFFAQTGYLPTIGAHYGYDIARIFLTAYERSSDTSGSAIKDALQHFDFSSFQSVSGITGMDVDGQVISPAALVMIKDGKNVEVK